MLQRRISKFGLSKQSAKGSAAAAATFAAGVQSGSVFKVDPTDNEIPSTWSNRTVQGFDRVMLKPAIEPVLTATPSLLGLLLFAALGADVVTNSTATTLAASSSIGATSISSTATIATGTVIQIDTGANAEVRTTGVPSGSGPYTIPLTGLPLALAHSSSAAVQTLATHTLTPTADLPYLTGFGRLDTEYAKLVDGKVSSLEISWADAGKLTAKATIPGLTPSMLAAAPTETNQEQLGIVGFFAAAGGTFLVEGAAAQVKSGTIKIDNQIEQVPVSSAVTPNEVFPGQRNISYSLVLVPQDLSQFREVVFGANTAGALSSIGASPYYGAVDLKFLGSNSQTAEIASPHCRFACAFPDSNPAGGPAEVTLEAVVAQPTSGADTTATVQNFVAAY